MDNLNNILKAWTIIEQLSEGEVNTNLKSANAAIKFNPATVIANDFYDYFQQIIKQKFAKKEKTGKSQVTHGIIFYFNVFKFQSVIDIIVEKYHLTNLQDEINNRQSKFSFALVFDQDMKLLEDQTFITISQYILEKHELISDPAVFKDYERSLKEYINNLFCFKNDNLNAAEYIIKFNQAFAKLCTHFNDDQRPIYSSVINNIETDAVNLHSFFIDDLKLAQKSQSKLLKRYLNGIDKSWRINLDPTQNIDVFKEILQPQNYSVGHFLSKFPASVMQQVAINLTINDKNELRTVNGPPGTGKTTLLKDLFAEAIVRQAKTICSLDNKNVYSPIDSKVGQTPLPQELVEQNIVVASSNNSAVQNIVNDLPLFPDKQDSFTEVLNQLQQVHYFDKIAGKTLKTAKTWGLFSAEGGSQSNLKKLAQQFSNIISELQDLNFQPDPGAYADFSKQYQKITAKREHLQKYAKFVFKKQEWDKEARKNHLQVDEYGTITSSNLTLQITQAQEDIGILERNYDQLKSTIRDRKFWGLADWILDCFFNGNNAENSKKNHHSLQALNDDLKHKIKEKRALENKLAQLQQKAQKIAQEAKAFTDIHTNVPNYDRDFTNRRNYDHFEEETYWYTADDIKEESLLFVLALRVRKQFLYENIKSLKAALYNWNEQDKQIKENQQLLTLRAWQWINFAIPVISTTFASFHRMFKNLPANSIANLFIDEAGQAVPQAVIGPLLKSKRVMAVGDPAQIKPVNTLDSKILSLIGSRLFNVSEKFVSTNASVQTIMDQASQYGYYTDKEQEQWIGIPLWVHRRCLNPMFSISNAISYNDNMVLPHSVKKAELTASKKEQKAGIAGAGYWIDISGQSRDKFVQEQADLLKQYIKKLTEEDTNPFSAKDIFVITPFKNVATKLREALIGFPLKVGTVHTFQGKENKIVFLVLGASEQEKGAAAWAVSEPNIINVAATRAQKWFFIIGDKKLYESLGTVTISKTIAAIDDYNNNFNMSTQ
ncbi:DEAD/DEAH box helicase [Lactobacillus xylocopicola]|uniref:DNA helicase n=1 Tax=Lactobacillus xylocopicola TaxID=2976676 RepID=A0ABM8BIN6_9LACO|nr:AAA domain-containing protein [Lactobacillus xylocopicola]BDR61184.1 DNA helicase [Lactobacillus xylocopicola]